MGRHTESRLKLATRIKVTETEHKVDSKLAKTNANGHIECIICKVTVKSATLWKVHINSKTHKERISIVKQIKSTFKGGPATEAASKPATKIAAKIAEKPSECIGTQKILPKTVTPPTPSTPTTTVPSPEKSSTNKIDTLLPEKFFDDPVKDAKIRNAEYKDPLTDEWERFQREIREASSVSVAIIAGEQIESAFDRDIDEINDQMKHWSRYMNLEARKGALGGTKDQQPETHSSDENETDDDATTEFSDWRSKSFI
ncbi:zinc finger protein 830 isoform X3 [Anastrepha obliqua]|uniref:zinc finger protein 830 isoform X3 n=1 Tax=Anastrepha obliqua TaxID=95512 RepID=UPI00240A739F|nr:zinc finger protein 830 isoform X3 [Anastrepha obliqua]XP_054726168.1 zinc finger protein 830 isoform X3 [Anastrepha obliqua]XP_054726169.1 zinc finger protein 830 isoform X3 [Anastrepha obliqua]XP_054726170.1 zinc finger protein 830 isoform X3 [Anastrepha obliqua]